MGFCRPPLRRACIRPFLKIKKPSFDRHKAVAPHGRRVFPLLGLLCGARNKKTPKERIFAVRHAQSPIGKKKKSLPKNTQRETNDDASAVRCVFSHRQRGERAARCHVTGQERTLGQRGGKGRGCRFGHRLVRPSRSLAFFLSLFSPEKKREWARPR